MATDKQKEYNRKYYLEHKSQLKANWSQWASNNKDYLKKYKAEWRAHNPDKKALHDAKYKLRIRMEIFDKYGHSCKCCGIEEYEFLQIDHVKSNGNIERKIMSLAKIYKKVLATNPDDNEYQLLCSNCHYAKSYYGSCPHNEYTSEVQEGCPV